MELMLESCIIQVYGHGEVEDSGQQLPGHSQAGPQAMSPEPAYKKKKVAHLRVKVPGGVSSKLRLTVVARLPMLGTSHNPEPHCGAEALDITHLVVLSP